MQQEGIEEKEPGMYFLGGFTSWERLETKGDFWIEDGTLMAHVSEETEVKDNANRIGGNRRVCICGVSACRKGGHSTDAAKYRDVCL